MSLLDFHMPAWMTHALCATEQHDPELFFPHPGGNGEKDTREVRDICRRCPVANDCLTYALEHDVEHGIWGGVTDIMRRRARGKKRPTSRSGQCAVCSGPTPDMRHSVCSDECRAIHQREYQRDYYRTKRSQAREKAS